MSRTRIIGLAAVLMVFVAGSLLRHSLTMDGLSTSRCSQRPSCTASPGSKLAPQLPSRPMSGRFVRAAAAVADAEGQGDAVPVERAFGILEDTRQRDTQWSIVYELNVEA